MGVSLHHTMASSYVAHAQDKLWCHMLQQLVDDSPTSAEGVTAKRNSCYSAVNHQHLAAKP